MASKRMIRREKKRVVLQKKYQAKRQVLREQLNDPAVDIEAKFDAIAKLEKMPRDTARVRLSRRCRLTGRVHAVYRKFGLSRNELRRRAMSGEVPGLVKASW